MNDLEHDLRDLFERRATDMGGSPEAPTQVLRRGRRHQVATAVGGAVAAIGALAVVVGVGAALLRNPTSQVPAFPVGAAPYGERTASIQGLSVAAPAGWTLIDDWPLANYIGAGSQTCSFTGQGVPVDSSGVPVGSSGVPVGSTGGKTAPSADASPSCTSHPEVLPAGLPILQLANWEIPLDQTVCGLEGQPPATVPSAGVAVYVAQNASETSQLDPGSCPGAGPIASVKSSGPGSAVAVVVAGADASSDDLAVVQGLIDQLGSATASMSPPVSLAPGYVVAAGNDGGTPWRIETSPVGTPSASANEAVAIVQDASSNDHAYDVPAPADGQLVAASGHSIADDGTTLSWGTADARVSTLAVEADAGSWPATLVPWPTGLADPSGSPTPSGSIWWAIHPPVKGAIRVTLNDGTTQLLSGNETAPTVAAEVPPTDFPGDVLSFGEDDGVAYVFGQSSDGPPALLMALGVDDRSNPMISSWKGSGAWPTNRPLEFGSSSAAGQAVFGTVTTNVAEVKVTTSDGRRRTVRTFQDLRPEFGDVVGWFVILPQPTNNLSTIDATIQYLDANGNEVAGASFMSLVGS